MKKTAFAILLVLFPASVFAFTIHSSSVKKIMAPSLSTVDISVSTSSVVIGQSGTYGGTTTQQDTVLDVYHGALVTTLCQISASDSAGFVPVFSAIAPSVATLDDSDSVSYVSNGTGVFNVSIPGRTRQISCPISRSGGGTFYTAEYYVPGSLAAAASSTFWADIAGKTASPSTYNVFSSTNDTNHVYVRNPNLFTGMDLTFIPVYSTGGYHNNGALISDDLMVFAAHTHSGPGATVYFVTNSNTTVTDTIAAEKTIAGTDITISKLTSSLAGTGITPAYIFASTTYPTYFATTSLTYGHIPFYATNQFRTVRNKMLRVFGYLDTINPATSSPLYPWFSDTVAGDSGSSVFTQINGHSVVWGTWYTAMLHEAEPSALYQFVSQIDAAATAMGATPPTVVDLSGFTSY